jgi:hypothetical protein
MSNSSPTKPMFACDSNADDFAGYLTSPVVDDAYDRDHVTSCSSYEGLKDVVPKMTPIEMFPISGYYSCWRLMKLGQF